MAAATSASSRKTTRASDGNHGRHAGPDESPSESPSDPGPVPPPQTPLDFALSLMRDAGKPDALRASMAKAAMPYLHKRGEEQEDKPEPERMSDLELAQRITFILQSAEEELEEARQAEEEGRLAEGAATTCPDERKAACVAPAPPPAASKRTPVTPSAPVRPNDVCRVDPYDPHPGYRWI
jgi:hypothetical protein